MRCYGNAAVAVILFCSVLSVVNAIVITTCPKDVDLTKVAKITPTRLAKDFNFDKKNWKTPGHKNDTVKRLFFEDNIGFMTYKVGPVFEFDFGESVELHELATKGLVHHLGMGYIKKYTLDCKKTSTKDAWTSIKNGGNAVWKGNKDSKTPVEHSLPGGTKCRFLKFTSTDEYHEMEEYMKKTDGVTGLRIKIVGCKTAVQKTTTTTTTKKPDTPIVKCPHKVKADVVFVLDMSLSVHEQQFLQEKQIFMRTAKSLLPDGSKFGLVTFSSAKDVHTNIKLDVKQSYDTFKKIALAIPKKGYMTMTNIGLMKGRKILEKSSPGRKKYIVLITDGPSSVEQKTLKETENLRKKGVKIIGIGIGKQGIITTQKYADKEYSYSLGHFKELPSFAATITKKICDDTKPKETTPKPGPTGTPPDCKVKKGIDLAFVMDASWSITSGGAYKTIKLQIIDFVRQLVASGIKLGTKDGLHVAVVQFAGKKGKVVLKLNHDKDIMSLAASIGSIQPFENAYHSPLKAGLEVARTGAFALSEGARLNAKKLVVAYTDGRSRSRTQLIEEMQKYEKASIAAIAISPNTWDSIGLKIVGNAGYYHKTKEAPKNIFKKILALCKEPCFGPKVIKKTEKEKDTRGSKRGVRRRRRRGL